jgi:hypothetical protein
MGKNPSDPYAVIPSGTIDLASYNKLLPLLQSNTLKITAPTSAPTAAMVPTTYIKHLVSSSQHLKNFHLSLQDIGYLSSFSSRGPTIDGRFKPDLLSDGEMIISANSDGQSAGLTCPITGGTLSMKGTWTFPFLAFVQSNVESMFWNCVRNIDGHPHRCRLCRAGSSVLARGFPRIRLSERLGRHHTQRVAGASDVDSIGHTGGRRCFHRERLFVVAGRSRSSCASRGLFLLQQYLFFV